MEILVMLLLLLLVCLLAIGIPATLAYFIYRFLKVKINTKVAVASAAIPLLIATYFIWTAFYPTDSFYKDEFTKITSQTFPSEADIEAKDSGYPDQHGDYASCAVIKMPPHQLAALRQKINTHPDFVKITNDSIFIFSNAFGNATQNFDSPQYLERFKRIRRNEGAFMFIGFLEDQKIVIVYRTSS